MKTQHLSGVVLVAASAVVFSLAGVFTKAVQADACAVIFWRGLSAAGFGIGYLIVAGRLRDEAARFGWPAVLAAFLGAVATAAFLNAFKLTSVANVALIWATSPFVTALLAGLALREIPSRRMMIAAGFSAIGVLVVLRGSTGGGILRGDLLAGLMVVLMSAAMVVFRVRPDTPTSLSAVLSSVLLLPFAWILTDPAQNGPGDLPVLLCFGLLFAFASVTLFEGVRRVPAAEAALIGTIETPLAPLWAFLVLSELPSGSILAGGAIILVAVVWSQMPARPLPGR